MSAKVIGLLFLAVGLAALIAGFQVIALVSAGVGLLFIASTARPGRRNTGRGHASASFNSGATYAGGSHSDTSYGDSSSQCDAGSSSDCGGSDGGGGGGGD
jgi:hypothetical protein